MQEEEEKLDEKYKKISIGLVVVIGIALAVVYKRRN